MILNSGSSLFSSSGEESITVDELGNLRCATSTIKIESTGEVSIPLEESNLKSIIKIEGSGVIFCIALKVEGIGSYKNLYGLKINIDNETLMKKNIQTSSSKSIIPAGIVCKDFFNTLSDDYSVPSTFIFYNANAVFLNKEDWPNSYNQVIYEEMDSEKRKGYECHFLIEKPLIFNNSFEIFADHETSIIGEYNANYYCLYKINE